MPSQRSRVKGNPKPLGNYGRKSHGKSSGFQLAKMIQNSRMAVNTTPNDSADEETDERLRDILDSQKKFQAVADAAGQIADGFRKFREAISSVDSDEASKLPKDSGLSENEADLVEIGSLASGDADYRNHSLKFNKTYRAASSTNNDPYNYEPSKAGLSNPRRFVSGWEPTSSEYSNHNNPETNGYVSPGSSSFDDNNDVDLDHIEDKQEWTVEEREALNDEFIMYFTRRGEIGEFTNQDVCAELYQLATEEIGIQVEKQIAQYLGRFRSPARPTLLNAIRRWIACQKHRYGAISVYL
ncbi:hypothetical protein G9A89_008431 [Geosiphon pyriformis]|nr:hypothetical protein G9A89_008431 [Geosiphon pyriformis]